MDKLAAITAFVKVASTGSFTAASSELLLSTSAITKSVSRLEKHLGVRLLNRTTHGIALTDDGAVYLDACLQFLDELGNAEHLLAQRQTSPLGRLRVSAPNATARIFLTPALPRFFEQNPGLSLDLSLSDQGVDLIEQSLDLAIRVGTPRESQVIARKLADTQRVTYATPEYLNKHGRPTSVQELARHNCVTLLFAGRRPPWRFSARGIEIPFDPVGNLVVNSGDELREAVLAGIGITQSNSFLAEPELRSGRLEPVLVDYVVSSDPIYAVYLESRHKQPRMQAFLTFLDEVFSPYRVPSDLRVLATRRVPRIV
jgi:DNA-binding transcriptional LysR family regulator